MPKKENSIAEAEEKQMVVKQSWDKFRESGLLWWVNMNLHLFGWSIIFEMNEDQTKITKVYPARVRFRGFDQNTNTKNYRKISNYLSLMANQLKKEAEED